MSNCLGGNFLFLLVFQRSPFCDAVLANYFYTSVSIMNVAVSGIVLNISTHMFQYFVNVDAR